MRIVSALMIRLLAIAAIAVVGPPLTLAQQTLGAVTGEVTDATGGVIPNATVSIVGEQTSLTRMTKTNGAGVYSVVNLPIGTYTLTYTAEGYDVQKTPAHQCAGGSYGHRKRGTEGAARPAPPSKWKQRR